MKLSATPFHPTTGDLLPAYRDAYLRGDLTIKNTEAVDAFMKLNSSQADATLCRFYEMKNLGHQVRPVGWVQRQFDLIRTEPQRFRQRAAAMLVGSVLVGGAVFAGTNTPNAPTENVPGTADATALTTAESAEAATMASVRVVTMRGRILNEDGKPLVGATVLDRANRRGVSTDQNGNYAIVVPAGRATQLQYAYAGYADEEVVLNGKSTYNTTLVPRTEAKTKKRHWWQF
ncbi:carboxypeptidase-like regulatory domain-containing protein [Hymenobacter mucosus]|uniref:CarboxypepD_reg-like domain-containing protein n=1 Tax=Hymenobacter mucosus TaxID=1411120 RepID=A0A239BEQ5_9BACT|nr:carboxypeptidase-like regulatory domain-containing protein [Hymenobacter mucosus]SNS06527.1 CarboxypepD_reg-like domain-containing protein [Hymenobacter mucosus]